MAFAPIAFVIPEYDRNLYSSWWLKAYEPGTTTPQAMATDSTGSTTAAKFQLNTEGFPITAGNALVVPHVDGDYDLWLFPTAAEADANDTTNALQFADNLGIVSLIQSVSNASSEVVLSADTVADLKTKDLQSGQTISTKGYYTEGDGGGASYLIQTAAEFGGTPDEYGDHTLANGNVAVLQSESLVSGLKLGMVKTGNDDTAIFNTVATSDNYDGIKLPSGSFGWSGNLFLSDGQMISGVGSGNTISGNKGSRLLPLSSDARIRLFPHSKLENMFIDGVYNGVDRAVDGIYLKPHELGDPDYESGDPVTASVIWTKVSNVNIQNFSNNISIEGEAYNLWFENLVSVAGRFKQVGGGESTLTACNLSDTTDQEILFNDGGKISVHGGAIQNTNGGYPCITNNGKMLLQGVYMENARAGANNNGYLIDNYGTLTLVQPKSMAIAEKGIRGRYGSKTYLRDVEFTGNNANTNEVFNGRGDNNNEGGGDLYFENLTFRSCDSLSINYIEHAIGGYSDKGYSIESGNEKTLYLNEGDNTTDLTSSGGTLTDNDTAEYLTNGTSLKFIAAASTPYVTLTKTLRGLAGHLVMIRWAALAKPSASDNTRFLANIGGDVTCSYVNVEFDADSANGNTDTWYYITTSAVLDPLLTEHTITCNLFTSLGGSGSSNGTNYIDRIELVDCGLVHKD